MRDFESMILPAVEIIINNLKLITNKKPSNEEAIAHLECPQRDTRLDVKAFDQKEMGFRIQPAAVVDNAINKR
ncbi:MAG: hypothetical protein ABI691_25325 [Ginsengibacter sp.]